MEKRIQKKDFINMPRFLLILVFSTAIGIIGKNLVTELKIGTKPSPISNLRKSFVENCSKTSGEKFELCGCIFDKTLTKFGEDLVRSNNHIIVTKGIANGNAEYVNFLTKVAPKECINE